jgi:hypothetical protein
LSEYLDMLSDPAQARFSAFINREPMPDVEFAPPIVEEFEAIYPIIAEMEGDSNYAIAHKLNARGYRNTVGNDWDSSSVRRLRARAALWRGL